MNLLAPLATVAGVLAIVGIGVAVAKKKTPAASTVPVGGRDDLPRDEFTDTQVAQGAQLGVSTPAPTFGPAPSAPPVLGTPIARPMLTADQSRALSYKQIGVQSSSVAPKIPVTSGTGYKAPKQILSKQGGGGIMNQSADGGRL